MASVPIELSAAALFPSAPGVAADLKRSRMLVVAGVNGCVVCLCTNGGAAALQDRSGSLPLLMVMLGGKFCLELCRQRFVLLQYQPETCDQAESGPFAPRRQLNVEYANF